MNRLISSLVVVLSLSFLSAGCTTNQAIHPENVYQGYPCGDRCEDFKHGFETAKLEQYKRPEDCEILDQKQRVGCLSYIHEYKTEEYGAAVAFDSQGRSK